MLAGAQVTEAQQLHEADEALPRVLLRILFQAAGREFRNSLLPDIWCCLALGTKVKQRSSVKVTFTLF